MPHARLALAFAIFVVSVLPAAAHAQVYKCPPPDGGHVVYQSTPCPVAGKPAAHPTAAQLNAQRASASAPAPAKRPATATDPYADGHRRRDCTIALQNQSVLKRTGRAYTTDAAGRKNYVADGDRARLVVEAEHQASQLCD